VNFENIAEKYMSLIKDMDSESVETVERIINRARRISKLDSGDVDIYTYEEQQELRQMFDHFDKNIVELNSELYCYKDYFMPMNYFNPSVLYYYHGMDELKTLRHIRQNDIIDAGAFIGDSALILSKYTVGFLTKGNIVVIFNVLLLIIGFMFLGKEFGLKTVYCSLVMSFSLQGLEYIAPLKGPLTNETIMELVYAIFLPAIGSAILFNIGASSGGTDILAMLLKKYTSMNIGVALMSADCILAALTFPIYGIKTGLMSMLGLGVKALVIDNVIESINLCKYINIVCNDPEPITHYIGKELNRSATVVDAKGAYTGQHKFMVLTVVNRRQAILLRNFLRETEPSAFIIITSTSEIVGKGFMRI